MGHLHEDAGPVAGGHLGPGGTPVGQVLQRRERLADQPVAAAALEVGHQRDAAGVVLERRVVQGRAGVAWRVRRECRVLRCRHSGLSVIGHAEVAWLAPGTTLALLQPP